jgi:hypothetical protein
MNKLLIFALTLFVFGWLSSSVYSQYSGNAVFSLSEVSSPSDHISEDNVKVYDDQVVVEIPGAFWARFEDTNSMDPVIDIGANSIEIQPKSPSEIKIGDIISYKSNLVDGIIIHRVVSINEDEDGIYYTAKGDNNFFRDPEQIRFDQVHGLVIGVLY